eukprot:TRINITY_DN12555_c0_g1_i8.p1 TRINITY_DN12555_c0_g1~~TRINITY_DN12555_c0_g1_i8.p1  ORF type:complete len:377 (+),score=112.03 TRINITY_DN12555_c0_g1_i8:123-1253(+)
MCIRDRYRLTAEHILSQGTPNSAVTNTSFKLQPTGRDLCEAGSTAFCWSSTGSQEIHIVDTGPEGFGRVLYLNCETQSSQADEAVYHESLVHPAMIAHPAPRDVFIGGGGEGGTPREVLKHSTVRKCVMWDLDQSLVTLSREQLPYWSELRGDDRLELHYGDAVQALVEAQEESFDVIIFDLPDAGRSTAFLWERAVLALVLSRLKPGGVFGTHTSGSAAGLCADHNPNCFFVPKYVSMLREVFPEVSLLLAPLPLWNSFHPFAVAIKPKDGAALHSLSSQHIDQQVQQRVSKPLRFYNGRTHHSLVTFPKPFLSFVNAFPTTHPAQVQTSMQQFYAGDGLYDNSPLLTCSCEPSECLDYQGSIGPFPAGYLNNEE